MSEPAAYYRKLGELLVFHHVISSADELTPANLKEVITSFQEQKDLFADGIPGRDTLWALQAPWVATLPKQSFVECDADVVPGYEEGLRTTSLRADVADRYNDLRNEIRQLGGFVTSDGGKRPLSADVNQNRSPTSMHYTGLAFDLYTDSGFFHPERDPYVITRGEDTYWIVWCRVERGEEKQLKAVYWENSDSGVDLKKTVTGRFVNLTDTCNRYGFRPIGPRTPFTRATNRVYLSAEWWHFQCNEFLTPSISQFGIELLKINGYTPEHIAAKSSDVWQRRKVIFGQNWH
jgi:hypothetical protein